MQTNSFRGRLVSLGIEVPVPLRYAPLFGVLQCEVGLDPMDPREPSDKPNNLGPEVLMRTLRPVPPQEPVQPVMHITAVSEYNQRPRESRDSHEDCVNLSSLGGLPWTWQGSCHGVETMGLEN